MGTVHQVLGVHSIPFTKIWLLNISIKKRKELLAHFAQAISAIHTVRKSTKTYIFTARWNISQLVEKLIKKFLMVLFMKRKLETNILKLFSQRIQWRIKNHSFDLSSEQA